MVSKQGASKRQTLVLIDAHALIHRSFHALPDLTNPDGEPVGAVYGVASVLLKLIRDLVPTHIAAAFDRPEPTFRHAAYEAYKGTRKKAPDGLIPQFKKSEELMQAFGIRTFSVAGFEADDIIGTLAVRFGKEKNLRIVIASGDLDTLQLVSGERVSVYTLRKGLTDTVLYDERGVKERFGFPPPLLVDYKGLKGDPSDNIIGVKGIGEKTATRLIVEYGPIEEFYKKFKKEKTHPKWISEGVAKKLFDGEDDALFSKELATIRTDAPVDATLGDLVWSFPKESAAQYLRSAHFRSLLARVEGEYGSGGEPATLFRVEEPVARSVSAMPWEALSRDARENILTEPRAVGVARLLDELFFAPDDKIVYCISQKDVPKALAMMLHAKTTPTVITHDANTFIHELLRVASSSDFGDSCDFTLPRVNDTAIAYWLIKADAARPDFSDVASFLRIPTGVDGASTATAMHAVWEGLTRKLKAWNLLSVYETLERPLIPVLARMEHKGISVDQKQLRALGLEIKRELKSLEKEIHHDAGIVFNILSPKQLTDVLFTRLGLASKGIRKTGTSALSTKGSELLKLSSAHPVVSKVMRYRELSKLLSTYIEALPELIAEDGRIHTHFVQTGTATGRLSSRDPNLQNIPIRGEEGISVRRAFVASPGRTFLSFDYSQVELRIAASLADDERMIDAFKKGEDIHRLTAAAVHGVAMDAVTPEMRRHAKVVNFGILYGMGEMALAETMHVSRGEARKYLEEYFHTFRGIAKYIERTKAFARKYGYVETLSGRRRYLPGLKSGQFRVVREAERMAVNAPAQGSGADMIKRAMIDVADVFHLLAGNDNLALLLQVHDDLLFEVRTEKTKEVAPAIRDIMERAGRLKVPILVDVKSGPNWADLAPFEIRERKT